MRAMMRKLGTYALVSTLILWASPGVAASLCLVIAGHTTSHEHAEHAHHSPHSYSDGSLAKSSTRDHARTEIDVCCSKVFQRGAGAVIVPVSPSPGDLQAPATPSYLALLHCGQPQDSHTSLVKVSRLSALCSKASATPLYAPFGSFLI